MKFLIELVKQNGHRLVRYDEAVEGRVYVNVDRKSVV